MIRVYRLPPFVFLLILAALLAVVAVSLPIFLLLAGTFFAIRLVSSLFLPTTRAPRTTVVEPGVSDTIENKRIGNYRIKTSEDDPNVIEVIDSKD